MMVYLIEAYDDNDEFLWYLEDKSGRVFENLTPEAASQTVDMHKDRHNRMYGGSLRVVAKSDYKELEAENKKLMGLLEFAHQSAIEKKPDYIGSNGYAEIEELLKDQS